MILFWVVIFMIASIIDSDVYFQARALPGLVQALIVIGVFASQWIYWSACEVLWNGQTIGKRLVGIRVVREDGAPVGFFESAVRNLLRVIDFMPMAYAVGVATMLVTKQNRRLGDIAAGTLLIRTERIDLDRYAHPPPAHTQPTAAATSAPALTSQDTELVLSFLERASTLAPDARQKLASGFVERLGASLPKEERAAIAASWETSERFLRERLQHRA